MSDQEGEMNETIGQLAIKLEMTRAEAAEERRQHEEQAAKLATAEHHLMDLLFPPDDRALRNTQPTPDPNMSNEELAAIGYERISWYERVEPKIDIMAETRKMLR